MIQVYYGKDLEYQLYLVEQEIKKEADETYDLIQWNADDPAFELADFIADLETISLFAQPKIFVIKNFFGLSAKWPFSEREATLINHHLKANQDWKFFFVNEATRLLKSTPIMKFLNTHARFFENVSYTPNELVRMLNHNLERYNIKLSKNVFDEIVKRTTSFSELKTTLNSLQLADNTLTESQILALINDPYEAKIYELCDALLMKQQKKAFIIYQSFKDQFIKAQSILFQLARQLRQYYQLFTLANFIRNHDEIAKKLKLSDRQVHYILNHKRHIITPNLALSYLFRLSILDQEIKLGKIEADLALEKFMLEILV